MTTTSLPTELVARLRAVDREIVGSALVDTPAHLDGNHRIAVARRWRPSGVFSAPPAIAQ